MNSQQNKAFNKFSKLKIGALFMQMGTGKTKVAIDLVNYNKVDLLLYVAPYSTLHNIETEINKWKLNTEYLLIGYETISSSNKKYLELLEKIKRYNKKFIIADESIFIKNEETKRFKRLVNIRNKCQYALILNGTPITKNEWDLYNQMYFLSPKIIGMTRVEFLNTFFKKIVYKKKNHKEHSFYKFSDINTTYLQKLISPYIFKSDLEFDNKESEKYVYVDVNKEEYNRDKKEKLNNYMINKDSQDIINMLQSLNVIAANNKDKNDRIIKYIKGKQIIVFCNFIEEAKYIHDNCDSFIVIGNTKNRKKIIEQFKTSNKPLIMTFGVGSYSLNLQFCNEIVYSSLTFDYAKMEQSKYRIKRIGQNQDIKYTYILSNLGINMFIRKNINKKQSLSELIKEKIEKGELEKWVEKYI